MNKEEVLKLAKESFANRYPVNEWFTDTLPNFVAFANACCDYQRESDAKLFDGITMTITSVGGGKVDLPEVREHITKSIRANKGE